MRTEEEIRAEVDRLEDRADKVKTMYARAALTVAAEALHWALGEERWGDHGDNV